MAEHWLARLKAGDTVLLVKSGRKLVATSRRAGEGTIVRLTRGATKAGFISVRRDSYGPIGSLLNRVRVFEKAKPGANLSASSRISWLEQDTPDNRARYGIDATGVNRPKVRTRAKDLHAAREEARREAIRDQALVLFDIVEKTISSNAKIPKDALALWQAVEREINQSQKRAAGSGQRRRAK
jgi:hypothetical protein